MSLKTAPFLLCILLGRLAGAEQTVATPQAEAPTGGPAFTKEHFHHASPQCRMAPAVPNAGEVQAQIAETFQKDTLAHAAIFFLQQTDMLRRNGLLRADELKANHSAFSKMKRACGKHEYNQGILEKVEQRLNAQQAEAESPDAIIAQKRYLAAMVEAQRIKLRVQDNHARGAERTQLLERLTKIQRHYPLAVVNNVTTNGADLMADLRLQNNPVRFPSAHPQIDDFLFPGADGKHKAVEKNSARPYLIDALLDVDKLPPGVQRSLSVATANAFNPILNAMEGLCDLNSCQTLSLRPTTLAEILNRLPPAERNHTLHALCKCEFGKSKEYIPQWLITATAVTAGTAAATCWWTAGIGCGAAIVMGLVTAAYGDANAIGAMQSFTEAEGLRRIAAALPGVSQEDINNLLTTRNEILREMGINTAFAAGGQGVATLAPHIAGRLRNFFKSHPVPSSTIANSAAESTELSRLFTGNNIQRTVSDTGAVSYHIMTPEGPRRLAMDSSGLAVSAQDPAVRSLYRRVMESGNQSVVLIDINNLGLANHMPGKSQTGDAYLAAVARIASEKAKLAGVPATLWRPGGDEFMLTINSTDRALVRRLSEDINQAVYRDPKARELFRAAKIENAQLYRNIATASGYDALPTSFRAGLSEAETQFARTNYEQFRQIVLHHQTQAIYNSAAVQPSVSIGSVIVGNRTAEQAYLAADNQLSTVKTQYKRVLGLDTSKYNGRPSYLPEEARPPRVLSRPPQVLDPVD